ncbi:hypothetical protein [Rhizobium lentis]|uniref:Scaffolding protein n=1 Tax=Rhizobium lentis TaxID=1138194 RepID=A0ABS7IIX0_9HYPH|nr:hypothetical protein [Rhizobium lentis]MBX5089354.1 hypothetical protein [Rhizobium lentis]
MNQARDDGGKFAATTPDKPEGAETAAEVKPEENNDQPLDKAPEPAKPAIEAPNSWSAEMKAKFSSLPPEAQEYIAQREREAHAAITQKGEQIKAFEPIRQTLDQHREVFVKNGVSEAEGVQRLFAADRFLQERPAEAIQWLANHYGVDLRQFATGTQQPDQSQQPSSEVIQLRRELAEIKNSLTARERSEQQAQTATVAQTIEKFASENPYFAEVEEELMGLIPVIKSKEPGLNHSEVLKKAYDRAVYANPDVRQRLQADQQKAAEEKRKAEEAEAVRKAKQAGGINQKSVQGTTPTKGASMEDTMSAVYDRLHGNG